jgi:hypothetical protein
MVCCFLTRPVLLMSSRSLPSETMVLFGVLLAVFLVGCEVIVIGVFVFGASCSLLCLWVMLVILFLVSFPVSELVSLFQFAVCCASLSVCSFPLVLVLNPCVCSVLVGVAGVVQFLPGF